MRYVGKKGSDWDVFNLVTSGIPKQRYRASTEYSCHLRMSWSYSPPLPPSRLEAVSSASPNTGETSPQDLPSTIIPMVNLLSVLRI